MKSEKDPKVKLTLSVKKSVIDKAKKYASEKATSLSHLIETHLSGLEETEKEEFKRYNAADQLFGCAKDSPLSQMTDDEIKDLWVKEKYGI